MNNKIQFLESYPNLKNALTELGLSGQTIKKYLSSKARQGAVELDRYYSLPSDLLNIGMIHPLYHGPEVKIIAEDDQFIALDKPEKTHCYPLVYTDQNNLLSFLRVNGYAKTLKHFDRFLDRNLLYRLDYETSGVVLFAKERNLDRLDELRKEELKIKLYTVVVTGEFRSLGEHTSYFKGSGEKGSVVKCVKTHVEGSQEGRLKVIESFYDQDKNQSLIIVSLISGRRHQIRSQFKELGFPILGDEIYGGDDYDRLCLHSTMYSVENQNYVSMPLFLKRDFLDLYSRFEMSCDKFGIC